MSYENDQIIQEENEQACINARRKSGIKNPEVGPHLDCATECPLNMGGCPLSGSRENDKN